MKKALYLLLALAGLWACRKEAPPATSGPSPQPASEASFFTASIGESTPEAKTSFSPKEAGGYSVRWSSGDRISVNGKEYLLSTGAGTQTAHFGPVSGDASAPYKVIYPASIRSSDTRILLPDTQPYADNSIPAWPMYAESSSNSLTFGAVCGVLKLTLQGTGSVKSIRISADQPVSGAAELVVDSREPYPLANITGGNGTLTMTMDAPVSIAAKKVFLFYLPVNEFTNLCITVTNQKGYSTQRTANTSQKIDRGKVTGVTLTDLAFDRYNGHRFVNLGLDSGLRWCACNVGAQNPQNPGDYFAWGATEPFYTKLSPLTWKSGKSAGYTLGNAPYYNGSSYSKYTTVGTVLESGDDAVTQLMGSGFRQATYTEWKELISNCLFLRASSYHGVAANGFYVFKAKSSADKGRVVYTAGGAAPSGLTYDSAKDLHIFLPIGGYFDGTTRGEVDTGAYYFTGSLSHTDWSGTDTVGASYACCLYIGGDSGFEKGCYERYFGFNLRGVRPYSAEESE
ncbi:MAG: hypothetical protein IJU13_00500 [Bacteroidales bacterium]|nr:hypothetical protein [Bacteroidales bacterium]